MDFKAALVALKQLDNGAELASAFEAEVERLNGKNYELIGEKRSATSKATAMEAALTAISSALGLEGDLDAVITGAEPKLRSVLAEATQLKADKTALETRVTAAEGSVTKLERSTKLSQVAAKTGAAEAVLERLFGDKLNEFVIDAEAVKVGDKALREYVEADETLKPFLPALFPQAQAQTTTAPKLPSGSPSGQVVNPYDKALERTIGKSDNLDWITKRS